MSEERFEFTKENIDIYLREVAKAYRKSAGKKMPAEIILIGGASVLINYGFRNMTTDIDALIQASSAMTDAIRKVGDLYQLPGGWLNDDFTMTKSYSEKLPQYSVYYKTYSNVVTIRTIAAEYLIAMKLRSGRRYKSDLSDILGILAEHEKRDEPISFDQIRKAVQELYGSWEELPISSRTYIEQVMKNGQFQEMYGEVMHGEEETKELLIQLEEVYPETIKEKNIDEIAENLQEKSDRASILQKLKNKKYQEGESH